MQIHVQAEEENTYQREYLSLLQENKQLQSRISHLEKEQLKWREVFDYTRWGICILTPKSEVIWKINPAFAQLYGYELEDLEGKPFADLFAPGFKEAALRIKKSLATNGHHVEMSRHLKKDGTAFPVKIEGHCVFKEDGQPLYSVINVWDKTRQSHMEKELEKYRIHLEQLVLKRTQELREANEELYRENLINQKITAELRDLNERHIKLLESIADGFFALDDDFKFIYINLVAQKTFGVEQSYIIGVPIMDVPLKGLGTDLYSIYRDVMANRESFRIEVYSEPLKRWFDLHTYPCPKGLSVYFHDITERKSVENELRRSEELLATLFRSSPHSMMIVSMKNSQLRLINDRFTEMMGLKADEVIGKNSKELGLWLNEKDRSRMVKMLKDKGRVRNFEARCFSRSNGVRTVLISAETLLLDRELCTLISMNDITELKRLEQEFFRHERLHLIGEMAAGIGHEVRNPMTTVRGFLQMFKEEEDWKKCQGFLDLMISELDRANDIISEFIYLARDKAVNKVSNNLNRVLESMLVLLQATAIEKGMVVRLSLNEIPDLIFDETEIRQMILNLARNGLEAMEPGGFLTLKTSLDKHGRVVLEVIDQGGKIKSDVLKKMGTPFFTTKDGGTGLGLAACYSIANRHHAKMSFKNSHWGTTVAIKFEPVSVSRSRSC